MIKKIIVRGITSNIDAKYVQSNSIKNDELSARVVIAPGFIMGLFLF